MKFISSPASEWMQSAGQTSTHVASFVPMQGCVMTYAMTRQRTLLPDSSTDENGDRVR
jgi:hypothetical protein